MTEKPELAKPLRSADLPATERSYFVLKEMILENELAPGEPVPVERLLRRLRVSRTPLREAILRLEREQFIEIVPRQGTFVSRLDLRQIREMYRVRRLLEGEAVREATRLATDTRLAEMALDLGQFDLASNETDWSAVSAAGHRLHLLIAAECGNQLLQRMLGELQDQFRRFRKLSLGLPEKVRSSHAEHLAILAAMQKRDAGAAEVLIRSHFDHASEYLLESLVAGHGGHRVTVNVAS